MSIDFIKHIDKSIFLFLNGLHCEFLDHIFFWGTKSLIWLPLYLLLLFLVIRSYGWNSLWIIIIVALMILFSDQLSNLFKDGFERLRPSYEPGLSGVHTVNGYKGGRFGFYSAHASTTMATAVYCILLLGKDYRFVTAVMLFWTCFMSYTRIYLGVHYPGDVLAGMVMGAVIGWMAGKSCLVMIKQASVGGRSLR